jgi:hypothetical protein
LGSGQRFFVPPFKDEREKELSGVKLTDMKKTALKICGESSVGFNDDQFDDCCISNGAPRHILKNSVCTLLEDAGFNVIKDEKEKMANDIEVTGIVDEFYVAGTPALMFSTNRAWTSISFKLVFRRNGKELGTKRIRGDVSGSPGGYATKFGVNSARA